MASPRVPGNTGFLRAGREAGPRLFAGRRARIRQAVSFHGLGNHPHDVGLLHDQKLFAVQFDLGARPLPEQDAVAGFDVGLDDLAALVAPARPDRNNLALRDGFSLAVSGMMMPPLLFSSASIRLTTTRSCRVRNLALAMWVLAGAVNFCVNY
jgi:hypothetical protein